MKSRRKIHSKRLDNSMFRRTAQRTAAANITSYNYRGGIRL